MNPVRIFVSSVQCAPAGLPSPEFRQDGRRFGQILWRRSETGCLSLQQGTLWGPGWDHAGFKVEALVKTGRAPVQ